MRTVNRYLHNEWGIVHWVVECWVISKYKGSFKNSLFVLKKIMNCSRMVLGQQRWMRTQRSWGVSKDAETSSPAGGHGITVRLEGWWTQGKNSYWALWLWGIWTLFANQAQGLQKLQNTRCSLCNIVAQGSWWMLEYPDRGSAKTWPAKKNIYKLASCEETHLCPGLWGERRKEKGPFVV